MQDTFDELYQKSQNGEVFENLMDLILSRDNILLAYRNIKANKGLSLIHISCMTAWGFIVEKRAYVASITLKST